MSTPYIWARVTMYRPVQLSTSLVTYAVFIVGSSFSTLRLEMLTQQLSSAAAMPSLELVALTQAVMLRRGHADVGLAEAHEIIFCHL